MDITIIREKDIVDVMKLWNEFSNEAHVLYKRLNIHQIRMNFYTETESYRIVTVCAIHKECMTGFASGVIIKGKSTAYITTVVVQKNQRRKGIGTTLLKSLEESMNQISESNIEKYDIVFFNPIRLEWTIPESSDIDHPGTPGVDMASVGYPFLRSKGYQDFAFQNTYYRDITKYVFSDRIVAKINKLSEQGITIEEYDPLKHLGFDALFDDLNSESWRRTISHNFEKEKSHPVLIVVQDGTIYGFTGPMYVQESKRGYFAGIGIHSHLRNVGAGSVLFAYLCKGLKELGAEYMTLFTGDNNPARHIYEKEGFKIVRTWANMRKKA